MNYITATQLRTKVPFLIKALKSGEKLNLVHRSKLIGLIMPVSESTAKNFRADLFLKKVKGMKLKKYSAEELKKRYKENLRKRNARLS